MQALVLWAGMAMTTLLFIAVLIQFVKAPDRQDTSIILYEKQSSRHRQWSTRIEVICRWVFAAAALAFWCAGIGYMGYMRFQVG